MTWQKAKNITLSRSGENGGCLPSLVASKHHHPLFLSHTRWVPSPNSLKHTIQNATVGVKGGHLRKGLKCFSRGPSEKERQSSDFFSWLGPPWLVTQSTREQQRPHAYSASWLWGGTCVTFHPIYPSNTGLHLPAFLASWHWPQLQRLPLGPFNGLCKQAGWLLGQIVYFVYSGTIPSRHVSKKQKWHLVRPWLLLLHTSWLPSCPPLTVWLIDC